MPPDLPSSPVLVQVAVLAVGLGFAPTYAAPPTPAAPPLLPASLPEGGWQSGRRPTWLRNGLVRSADQLQVVGLARGADTAETRQRAQIDAMTRVLAAFAAGLPPGLRPAARVADPAVLIRDHPDWMPMTLLARDLHLGGDRGSEPTVAACYTIPAVRFDGLLLRHRDHVNLAHLTPSAPGMERVWPIGVGRGVPEGIVVMEGGAEGIQVGDRVIAVEKTVVDTLDAFRAAAMAAIARDPDRLDLQIQRGTTSHRAILRSTLSQPVVRPQDMFPPAPTCGPCCHGAGWPECGPEPQIPPSPRPQSSDAP